MQDHREVEIAVYYRIDRFFPSEQAHKLLRLIYDYIAAAYRSIASDSQALPFENNLVLLGHYRRDAWKLFFQTEARALTGIPVFTRVVIDCLVDNNDSVRVIAERTISEFLQQRYSTLI